MNQQDSIHPWKEEENSTSQLELTDSELEQVEGGDWSKRVRPVEPFPYFPICPPVVVLDYKG